MFLEKQAGIAASGCRVCREWWGDKACGQLNMNDLVQSSILQLTWLQIPCIKRLSRLDGRRQSLSRTLRYPGKRGIPFFVSSR
jgi:hypothetical protein